MDRNKAGSSGGGRPTKSKLGVPHHGSELFALGAKTSTSSSGRDDSKSKVMSSSSSGSKSGSAGSTSDHHHHHRKRDATSSSAGSSSSSIPHKKSKLSGSSSSGGGGVGGSGSGSSGLGRIGDGSSGAGSGGGGGGNISSVGSIERGLSGSGGAANSSSLEYWEQLAIDCDAVDLIQSVLAAIDMQDSDTVIGLICGAIRTVICPRAKPEPLLSLSLLYLAKIRSHLFGNETITAALVSILRRDTAHAFKGRNNPTMHVLASNLLARGYHNKSAWPEKFVRIYIDDAINERVWVDIEDCAAFVENICTAFGTRVPPKSMLQPELMITPTTASATSSTSTSASTPTPSTSGLTASSARIDILAIDDDSAEGTTNSDTFRSIETASNVDCPTQPRYGHLSAVIEKIVLDSVKELLNRRQAPDSSTRNLLRFLSATSGYAEIRALASYGGRLEHWMHNAKLMKPAQELLTYICYNVTGATTRDNEVLHNLVKMRLKTKPLINTYMGCLKEMINLQPNILYTILKFVVQNELSSVRNPNNMGMLATMFQAKPEEAAQHLAEIYQEFLLQREDCLRTLRVFLRELSKVLRFDIKLTVFCKKLLGTTKALTAQVEAADYRDRIFYSMCDLVCLCMFLSVSPQIKEANVSLRTGRTGGGGGVAVGAAGSKVLIEFYEQMSQIQCDALQWIYDTVPKLFRPTDSEYSQALHKLLFLDAPEQYSKADQWPPEQERTALLRMVSEIPLLQQSILCIILIGINKEIPFKVPDTVEIIEQVIRRAAGLKLIEYPVLEANKLEIIDFLFSMAEYHHPENIALPLGYEPPKLAISSLYWKAWNILLMLSAHNPSTFGAFCWEQYPMLRNLMEMCITNQFTDSKPPDEELQVAALERTHILEFETHLAAATSKVIITEQNSLLLSQLMLMDPMGVARRPPMHILEQFQMQNGTHKLGHLLCRSRKPDLLLDIIQRQGSSQSMPWLADLVQNSEGDFNHLPVQCLCEFLLSNSNNISNENSRDIELLSYLQRLLVDENGDHQTSCEVLEYFLRRLSSTCKQSRQLAIIGLRLLLRVFQMRDEEGNALLDDSGGDLTNESDWLLRYLPMMPYFMSVRLIVIVQLRAACQIENNPDLVMIYIQFIAANTLHDQVPEMLDHVMDMSQLIVERTTVFSCIIPTSVVDQPPPVVDADGVVMTNECRLQTLNCLFVMYNNYLIKLREHKTPIAWPEYPDLLMVHFSDGNQLPIHLNIIQAFVILLTYSSMIPNSQPILDYWFPPGGLPPQAFTTDAATNEPVQILPDWLKLKMIRCSVDRLVDAALIDLTPDQIVLFVQNFGTPVPSMSKLLALLDRAVIEQFETVKQTILNKVYLAQLIEIQQSRGAKNGHIAVQALELHGPIVPDPPRRQITGVDAVALVDDETKTAPPPPTSRTKEIEDIVDVTLSGQVGTNRRNFVRFRRLMQQLIARDMDDGAGGIVSLPPHLATVYGTSNSMQTYAAGKVLQYFHRMLKGGGGTRGAYIFQQLVQTRNICTLFRSLLAWPPDKPEMLAFMVQVMQQCAQAMNPNTNPVLYQVLVNKTMQFTKTMDGSTKSTTSANLVRSTSECGKMKRQEFVHMLRTNSAMELEAHGKQQLNELFKITESGFLVDAITAALKSIGIDGGGVGHMDDNNKIGLLVDWLANIDSEVVVSTREHHQVDLLFSRSEQQFRFYLLSLLSHQTSWPTLAATFDRLLSAYNDAYDPAAVLNFIEALIRNPKLWQGRDKATPKHEQLEFILKFNCQQMLVFTDYVMSESKNVVAADDRLNDRVQMMLKCIQPTRQQVRTLCKHVQDCHSETADQQRRFLQQLYLNAPPLKLIMPDLRDVYDADATQLVGCVADIGANYMLTAISSLSAAKELQWMSGDMELLVRKFAATHPSLVLRQLPLIASLLHGRAHMDLHILRKKSMPLFNQVLGIIELLQPLVFADAHKEALHGALDCYFTLFRNHGRAKEVYQMMYRFMELLQAYTNSNAHRALHFIEKYAELMQYLSNNHRNIMPLQQLVQGVSLLKHRHTHDFRNDDRSEDISATEDPSSSAAASSSAPLPSTSSGTTTTTTSTNETIADSSGAAAVILAPYIKPNLTPQHWPSLIQLVQRRSGEEILAALQEIEIFTSKRQGLLSALFERLLELLQSQTAGIRSISHTLLVRHLKHNPGDAIVNAKALAAYMQCLRDPDPLIVSAALETLTDIVICLQESAGDILRLVFELGIQSKQNTFEQLRRCVTALKSQHAC